MAFNICLLICVHSKSGDFAQQGYGKNKAAIKLADSDLLQLFNKAQNLEEKQKSTIVELLKAFILSADLKQQLSA